MRYAWHQREAYLAGRLGRCKAIAVERILAALRGWDRRTAERVTHFVAISRTVQQRIAECYGRPSTVIYPPVDTEYYCPIPAPRADYYLVVSAFAPYKRLDLAIEACNRLRKPLLIIGTGQDARRLRSIAGPTVSFLGWQPDAVIRRHLRRCRALLFPGEEDFGIVPVEAQSCGAPVIAFGRGGAAETVIPLNSRAAHGNSSLPEPTGWWFEEQSAACVAEAIQAFESRQQEFNPAAARRQALQFNPQRFQDDLIGYLTNVLDPTIAPVRRAA